MKRLCCALAAGFVTSISATGLDTADKRTLQTFARLPKTEATLVAVRAQLAAPATSSQRVFQVLMLTAHYDRTQKTPQNDLIIRDLRILARSGDREVARTATFCLTGFGFISGFEELLDEAKNAAVMDAKEYLAELAQVLPLAPKADQVRLARILRNATNPNASEIVVMLINTPLVKSLSDEARAELAALLDETEPQFPATFGVVSSATSVLYPQWLNAVATARVSVFNEQAAELVMNKLHDAGTEPRKVLAYLSSPYADKLFKIVSEKSRYQLLVQKIAAYAEQFPADPEIQALLVRVTVKVDSLPR